MISRSSNRIPKLMQVGEKGIEIPLGIILELEGGLYGSLENRDFLFTNYAIHTIRVLPFYYVHLAKSFTASASGDTMHVLYK